MMGWFTDLKIKVKLMLGFLILCLIMLGVGAMGLSGLETLNGNMKALYSDSMAGISSIKDTKADIQYVRLLMQRMVLPQYSTKLADLEKETKDTAQIVDKLMKDYEQAITNPEDRAMFQDFQKLLKNYREKRDIVLNLVKKGDYTQAEIIYQSQAIPANVAIIAHLEKMSVWNDNVGKKYIQHAEESYAATVKTMISIIAFGLIMSIILGYLIARSIERPIKTLVNVSDEVAAGNLRHNIAVNSKDEIGQLETAIKKMVENLRNVITSVQSSAELVASSSQELTASADQSAQAANNVATSIMSVAQGAERQVTIVGETVHTAEKMSAEAEQIAANANVVADTSDKTAQSAEMGGKAVETAINQMVSIQNTVENLAKEITGLGVRSKEIGQIVETISGIAGQTNLLALNAAIEAARAGEQGRGFAVVAEEVRKLAEQSGEAAKQISTLIGAIQNDTSKAVQAMEIGTREVKTGSELVDNAGVAFKEIAVLIGQTSVQVKEISEAIHHMANDSQTIVAGAQEVDILSKDTSSQTQTVSAATEEQLASMEEIASSSQALAKRAEELQAIAQKFVI